MNKWSLFASRIVPKLSHRDQNCHLSCGEIGSVNNSKLGEGVLTCEGVHGDLGWMGNLGISG